MTTTPSNVRRLTAPTRAEVRRYYERMSPSVEAIAPILPEYTHERRERQVTENVNDAMWLLSFHPTARLEREVRRELWAMDDPHEFTSVATAVYPEDRETALELGSGMAAMKAALMVIHNALKEGRAADAFFYLWSIQEELWLPMVLDLKSPPWSDIKVDTTFPMTVSL